MQAQAEHRARYPDWRFRPGTNVDAIAKRKTKDKNKDRPPARRRRNPSTRDKGPIVAAATSGGGAACGDAGGGGRCKGTRGLIQERRCAQIAELVARGFKGVALTSAVQAWDKESGASNVTDGVFVSEQGGGVSIGGGTVGASVNSRGRKEMRDAKDAGSPAAAIKTTKTRSASTAQQARFFNDVPFTSMFRRAASVPLAPDHGGPAAMAQGVAAITPSPTITTTTSISPVPDLYPPPLSPASSVSYGSELSFPDSDNMSVSACALPLPSSFFSHFFFFHFIIIFLLSGPSHVRFRAFLTTGQPLQSQLGQQRPWRARRDEPYSRHGTGRHRGSSSSSCRPRPPPAPRTRATFPAKFLLELLDAL